MNKRKLGDDMEMLALHFLEKNGYSVIEKNFYMRGGEADIIAVNNDDLCFIEVKYRSSDEYGTSFDAVTFSKRRKLIKTARYYLLRHPEYDKMNIRFDVLGIDGTEIRLVKAAFDAV